MLQVAPVLSGGAITVNYMNSPTSFNSQPASLQDMNDMTGDLYVKLVDDNTDLKISISRSGKHWMQVFSAGRTAFLTPDRVVFYGQPNHASQAGHEELVGYEVS